jgi:ATP-dependent DNA ligase
MSVRLTMNYSEVTLSDVESAIADSNVAMEQKVDGTRSLVVVRSNGGDEVRVQFLGRGGTALTHAAAKVHFPTIAEVLIPNFTLEGEAVLDGEILFDQGRYVIFDLPYLRIKDTEMVRPTDAYRTRRQFLGPLTGFMNPEVVSANRTEWTEEGKRALFESARLNGSEGVMLKDLDSPYEPGKRAKHSRKVKFVKTADVVVTGSTRGRNEAGRETGAFSFAAYDGTGSLKSLGSCSAIGKPQVEVGDVIEVAYLYRALTGGLVQPRMLKVRTDKRPEDCTLDQFPLYSKEVL